MITDSKIIKDHNIQDITFTQYQNLASSIIGSIDIKDILDDDEVGIFEAEYNAPYTSEPLGATKLVVVLKATRLCNLRCTYCNSWAEGPNQTMKFETLVRVVKRIMALHYQVGRGKD